MRRSEARQEAQPGQRPRNEQAEPAERSRRKGAGQIDLQRSAGAEREESEAPPLGIEHGGTAHAEQVGVLAQEVEKVYPELVSTGPDGFKSVNYAQLTPVLIEAMKEQQQQIEALKAQNQALQARTALVEADHASLLSLQAQLARLLGEGAQARK